MRVDRSDAFGFPGAALVAAGLFGFWGWPAAALFVGSFLILLALGAAWAQGNRRE